MKGKLCFKTIYNWLNKGITNRPINTLIKVKSIKKPCDTRREKFKVGIREIGEDIKQRKEIGHWELDTVLFSRKNNKVCFAIFTERK